jgi:hypothetical protein
MCQAGQHACIAMAPKLPAASRWTESIPAPVSFRRGLPEQHKADTFSSDIAGCSCAQSCCPPRASTQSLFSVHSNCSSRAENLGAFNLYGIEPGYAPEMTTARSGTNMRKSNTAGYRYGILREMLGCNRFDSPCPCSVNRLPAQRFGDSLRISFAAVG